MHNYTTEKAILNLPTISVRATYLVVICITIIIFVVDVFSTHQIPIFLYYVFPVMLAAWRLDELFSNLIVVISSLASVYVISGSFTENHLLMSVINLLQTSLIFYSIKLVTQKFHHAWGGFALNNNLDRRKEPPISHPPQQRAMGKVIRHPSSISRKVNRP